MELTLIKAVEIFLFNLRKLLTLYISQELMPIEHSSVLYCSHIVVLWSRDTHSIAGGFAAILDGVFVL